MHNTASCTVAAHDYGINANPFVPTRYIEVRSLRFCPELRKYVDRDVAAQPQAARESSSITIAKLRVL